MAFAVSEGKIRSVHKPTYSAPASVRLTDDLTQDYAQIYRSQQPVRTVVDFLARNIAQLSLHTFRRVGETDRQRLRDHPLATLLGAPNAWTTSYRLMRGLVSDLGIYDRALWLKSRTSSGGWEIVRVPPGMWKVANTDNWLRPEAFIITGARGKMTVAAKDVVYFRGYNPDDDRNATSPIETLRRALSEEYSAGQMREQVMRNGARHSGYITRPKEAKEWSDAAARRFKTGWREQYAGWSATEGGGTPVLEDGMTFVPASQSATDLQYIESRKLTREEVAAAYFIPPPMIGILDNASFSNITEQHKMLYQDTLGPRLKEIQEEIALQLLPDLGDTEGVYVEFNMQEKLRGSFEEQAAHLQTSVGAPYLTRNEARARANLHSVPGGDELVTPLNVLVGGQASPSDSGTQNERAAGGALTKDAVDMLLKLSETHPDAVGRVIREMDRKSMRIRAKEQAPPTHEAKVEEVMAAFFERQSRSVLSALGTKAPKWWDEERWDRELAADLLALALETTKAAAVAALVAVGFSADDYDLARTEAFLAEVAKSRAAMINATTREQVGAIVSGAGPAGVTDPAHAFDVAKDSRAGSIATTLVTTFAAFATTEAARQNGGSQKTWLVTSGDPRASHASMHGETVGIDESFSNGANWPGDPVLGAEGVSNCRCDVEVTFG
ncbi:phage portal protein [Microbacterium karelineae]|uniref:phage portal protein n=1 Tax=Microbacterium karelineae TaxID=2654283 RepID=UPI0012EAAE4D|nr:phage portal protein [Microbacterium karelineae]